MVETPKGLVHNKKSFDLAINIYEVGRYNIFIEEVDKFVKKSKPRFLQLN